MTQHEPRTDRERAILNAVRMIATLGHSCGLVDGQPARDKGGVMTGVHPAPILGLLEAIAETQTWLHDTWEYRRAVERAKEWR